MNKYLFIGGPWDGQKREVSDSLPEFKVEHSRWIGSGTYRYTARKLPDNLIIYVLDVFPLGIALQRLIDHYGEDK